MATSLIKLSTSLKTISTLQKYAIALRFYQSNKQVKDLYDIKSEISSTKHLFELLNDNNNPSSLIANIQANKNIVDGRHVIVALKNMQKFYQANAISPSDVQESIDFKNMCSILYKHLVKLDLPQVIDALKVLNLLQVPSSTMIIQSLLQLIRHSINDLNMQQIYFLHYVLKLMKPTYLSEAIINALPKLFIAQIQLQMDKEDIKELNHMLRYASDYVTDRKTIEYIVNALSSDKILIDVDTAKDILWSLSHIKPLKLPSNYSKLLHRVQNVINTNLNLLKGPEIIRILSQILIKVNDEVDDFYNPFLIDKLIDKIVVNNCGFEQGIVILKQLNKMKHINEPLLKYLSLDYYKNPLTFSQSQLCPEYTSTLVAGLAIANYKPPIWNDLQQHIIKNYKIFSDDLTLFYLALHLASLDCHDSEMYKQIFTSHHTPELMPQRDLKVFQQLYQTVRTLYPAYSGPWPSDKLIESFPSLKSFDKSKECLLLPTLEKLLGGSAYIKTGVKTNLGHDIDHLIIMQDEYPIIVESKLFKETNFTYIDDLSIPTNSKRLAVLLIPPKAYGRNIDVLNAVHLLNIKSLKAMSYTVIPISIHTWMTMPVYDRLPYLRKLLGLKNKQINKSI